MTVLLTTASQPGPATFALLAAQYIIGSPSATAIDIFRAGLRVSAEGCRAGTCLSQLRRYLFHQCSSGSPQHSTVAVRVSEQCSWLPAGSAITAGRWRREPLGLQE